MHSSSASPCLQWILVCAIINGIDGYQSDITLFKQYNLPNQDNLSLSSDNEGNRTKIEYSIDAVIRLHFNLDETKIVPYLRDEIYEHFLQHNITTQDLIDLWNLEEYEPKDLLQILEIPEVLLNLNTFRRLLGISNLTFNEYYTDIKKHIDNTQLREALSILEIDVANFSTANTFGTEDQVYEVLSSGSYSWEKFEEIYNHTGLNVPTITKNLILSQMRPKNLTSLLTDFQKFPIILNRNMYQSIWNQMNITTFDIYRVANLKRIVDKMHDFLKENITLGVAVSENEIILHEGIHKHLEKMENLILVSGESASSHLIYENLTFVKTQMRNAVFLWSNISISPNIEINNRENNGSYMICFYLDDDLTERNVSLINITQYNVTGSVNDGVHFNFGNPLICDGTLLGLAASNMMDQNIFIFDTIHESSGGYINSGNNYKPLFHFILFTVVLPFLSFEIIH